MGSSWCVHIVLGPLLRAACPTQTGARLHAFNHCADLNRQPTTASKVVQSNSVVWRSSKATSTATRTTASGSERTRVAVASASTSGTGTKIKNSLQPPKHKAIPFPVNKEVRASGLPIGWRIGGIAIPFIPTRLTSFLPQLHVRTSVSPNTPTSPIRRSIATHSICTRC